MALTDDLTAYYKLEDETATVGQNLTNVGSTPFSPAKIANGADGGENNSDRYLANESWSPITFAEMNTAWSIGFWVYQNTADLAMVFVFNLGSDGSEDNNRRQVWFGLSDTNNYVISMYPNFGTLVTAATIPFNTFVYLMGTYDGSTMQFYINGSPSESINGNFGSPVNGIPSVISILTQRYGGTSYNLSSVIVDECGFWTRALSSTEVSQLYNSGAGLQYPFTTTTVNSGFFNLM